MPLQTGNRKYVAAHHVLAAVSRELQDVAKMCDQLQLDMSEVLKDFDGELPACVYQLQNLDRITQVTSALADFLEQLAQTTTTAPLFNAEAASQAVMLTDLARRLANCHGGFEATTTEEAEAGECTYL